MMIQRQQEISDEQWEQIKDLFPPYQTERPSKFSDRSMFIAFWITRSGAAWRDLSEEHYGSWKTAYSGFCKERDWITLHLTLRTGASTLHRSAGAKKRRRTRSKPTHRRQT